MASPPNPPQVPHGQLEASRSQGAGLKITQRARPVAQQGAALLIYIIDTNLV